MLHGPTSDCNSCSEGDAVDMSKENDVSLEDSLNNDVEQLGKVAAAQCCKLIDDAVSEFVQRHPAARACKLELENLALDLVADRHTLFAGRAVANRIGYLRTTMCNAFFEYVSQHSDVERKTHARRKDRFIREMLGNGYPPVEVMLRLYNRGVSVEQEDVDLVAAVLSVKEANPKMKAAEVSAAVLAETGIQVSAERARTLIQRPKKMIVPSPKTVALSDILEGSLPVEFESHEDIELPEVFPVEDKQAQEQWPVFRQRVFALLIQGLGAAEISAALGAGRRRVGREIRRISARSPRGGSGSTDPSSILVP